MTSQNFAEILDRWPVERVRELIGRQTRSDVIAALERPSRTLQDFAALLSQPATDMIEPLAQLSAGLTRRRFGHTIQFYVPLYISNFCCNSCRYCGFNQNMNVLRRALTIEEAVKEAEYLRDEGFRHVLLVSGEDRQRAPLSYFEELVEILRSKFASVSIEIYPLDSDGYRRLAGCGVDGLTLYQETYNPSVYEYMHPAGPKKDFLSRLNAIELGAAAGMRSLGIGALLGLASWREEFFYVGMHASYLQRRFWRSHVSVSFPRMRRAAGAISPPFAPDDGALVQMICALRLMMPDADIVLSTREPARLRDRLLSLGITRISAASVTEPGGYSYKGHSGAQFEVMDARSLKDMAEAVRSMGLDPVFKSWDASYAG